MAKQEIDPKMEENIKADIEEIDGAKPEVKAEPKPTTHFGPCPTCAGKGLLDEFTHCPTCAGSGKSLAQG
jgi:RecJ-like exonuclease